MNGDGVDEYYRQLTEDALASFGRRPGTGADRYFADRLNDLEWEQAEDEYHGRTLPAGYDPATCTPGSREVPTGDFICSRPRYAFRCLLHPIDWWRYGRGAYAHAREEWR